MRKTTFYHDWMFWKDGQETCMRAIQLPHDAMLGERRSETSAGGANISWFEGGDYIYEKTFDWPICPDIIDGSHAILEFEGVYQHAIVFLNGKELSRRPYGYTNFYVDMTEHLTNGKNVLRVMACNAQQPNSRWYTGSGVYRPVNLYLLPPAHILLNGVSIKTLSVTEPCVRVTVCTSAPGMVRIQILLKDGDTVLYDAQQDCQGRAEFTASLPGARLWSPESPSLYVCRVSYGDDMTEETFGVRTVEVDAKKGLRINGKRVILRGACIHHDNGVLGAVADPFAEERKVRLLQKVGYNAIRSAHNPCSKALLSACDALGMLVMDEYIDMWYIHKTQYDYVEHFDKWWRQDLTDMINKDYNHPSVILYSIGNEVAETSQPRGIALTKEMSAFIAQLDDTRKVTCGINIFFNYLFSLGFGVYSDEKAKKTAQKPAVKHSVGSEFYNNIAGMMGASFMKFGATLRGSDRKTRDAYANMHIAGYNYGVRRYRKDMKRYPERVILGTETFCADAYAFWEMAKQNPALIGDFVWAGMDYLGESGIGAWEYKEYAPDFSHGVGWLTAGSGRLDITGRASGEALYTRVAFELDPIHMAVVPVGPRGRRHSPSAWKFSSAIPSWSFHGKEGMEARVEVYARAERVELYVNEQKVGEKRMGGNCRFCFRTPYRAGTLKALAYDKNGTLIGQAMLKTAGDETRLTLLPELDRVHKDELCYVRIRYTDSAGELKPLLRGRVRVRTENGTLLGLGNGCSYNEDGYLSDNTDTYYGEALAVVRPNGAGAVHIHAESPFGAAEAEIALY